MGRSQHARGQGESIRLDEALWVDAQLEQEKRTSLDPWQDILKVHLAEYDDDGGLKITTTDVWKLLGVDTARIGQHDSTRLTQVMALLGWRRTGNRLIKVGSKLVSGYVKGRKPWRQIKVLRDKDSVETHID